jgi:hypothetical protein
VAVTGLQGLVNSLADLARGGLPGTKAQLAIMWISNVVLVSLGCTYGIWWPVLRVTFFPRDIVVFCKIIDKVEEKKRKLGELPVLIT